MNTALLTFDGMVRHHAGLLAEHLIDRAVVDSDGRLLVSMIDVLAMARLDADAEVIRVRYCNGASFVVRVAEVLDDDLMYLRLDVSRWQACGNVTWRARLWSPDSGSSPQVGSIHAMTFATFVGQS